MKLHKSSVDKILRAFSMWGGRSNDDKIIEVLSGLDFEVYEQQNQNKVLVPTDVMQNEQAILAQKGRPYVK